MATKLNNTQADDNNTPHLDPTVPRYLTPEMARIHLGSRNALHVTVLDDRIYGGVYAAYVFAVRHPRRYVSLRYKNAKGEEIEVGIIRDLADWPDADRALVEEAVHRHYFVHTITRIDHIGWKYGFIAFDVQTDKGPAQFLMRWQHDRAHDYGRTGKILLDVDENRYLIPDLQALSDRERDEFLRYVYW
jgi:hypothetical protein